MKRKLKMISLEVDLWLSENDWVNRKDLERRKKMIMKNVQQKLKDKKDIDVNNILSILPRCIMHILRLKSLKKVCKLYIYIY